MKKLLKRIGKTLLILIAAVAVFLIGMTVYHHVMLSREAGQIKPNGKLVTVDGHKMHVYVEGNNQRAPTLVLMSGSGVAAPVYDYKVLYSKLSGTYRVAVIEKFGYGYSDVSGLPRDIDTLVREDREALKQAGISGPYVLMPHSMSGLEALYWAQRHPDEVPAIVGLDPSVPETYEPSYNNDWQIKLLQAATFTGLHRIPLLDPVSERGLTASEVLQHKLLNYKVTLNSDIAQECRTVGANAKAVKKGGVPNIPMLMFCSNGEDTGTGPSWVAIHRNYAGNSDKIKLIQLNCGHFIHYYKSDEIAKEIKDFMKQQFKNS